MKIIIPGGNGQVGRMLVRALIRDGHECVVLTRGRSDSLPGARSVAWDGRSLGPWRAELDGAELPDRNDLAQWPTLREKLAEIFAGKTQAEWAEIFDGTDACVAPVVPMNEAHTHPHNVARGTYVERDGIIQAAPAPRFSRTEAELGRPPSAPGADTTEVLTSWGISNVDQLIADGIAVQAE